MLIGLTFQGPPWLTIILSTVWSASAIADSAQFSATVSELSDASLVGSAVTFLLAAGFSVTTISINLIPLLVQLVSWHWAFAVLAAGPVLGVLAMLRLRRDDNAARLAQGRR